MDCLVRVFHGDLVRDDREFEKMNEEVMFFNVSPSFDALVSRCRSLVKWRVGEEDIEVRGRFDFGRSRPHYVFMKLSSESDWERYKEMAKGSNASISEVVVERPQAVASLAALAEELQKSVMRRRQSSS